MLFVNHGSKFEWKKVLPCVTNVYLRLSSAFNLAPREHVDSMARITRAGEVVAITAEEAAVLSDEGDGASDDSGNEFGYSFNLMYLKVKTECVTFSVPASRIMKFVS
jgi:hypothetical protein